CFEEFDDRGGRNGCDDQAASGLRFNEAFGGEPAQGFAQWSAGDSESGGLFHFGQDGSRREFPRDDAVAEGGICAVARSHPPSSMYTHSALTTVPHSLCTEKCGPMSTSPGSADRSTGLFLAIPCTCPRGREGLLGPSFSERTARHGAVGD